MAARGAPVGVAPDRQHVGAAANRPGTGAIGVSAAGFSGAQDGREAPATLAQRPGRRLENRRIGHNPGVADDPLPRASRRVAQALAVRGHAGEVRVLSDSARTAAQAAAALGVGQGQIVKSLVFRGTRSGEPILVLLGGASRVEPAVLATHLGEGVERADADWIRERTGFAIGGIPPVGHDPPLRTVADTGLLAHTELWAAGGTPHTVFPLRGDELVALTGAELATVTAEGVTVEEAQESTPEIAAAVAALVGELSRSAAPPGPAEVERIVASPASHLLLARSGGQIVGMLTLVVFPIPSGVRAWIEDVVVGAAARERGVGAALNRSAIGLALDLGARTVDLTSRPEREAANRLYARLGFARRETNVYRFERNS